MDTCLLGLGVEDGLLDGLLSAEAKGSAEARVVEVSVMITQANYERLVILPQHARNVHGA